MSKQHGLSQNVIDQISKSAVTAAIEYLEKEKQKQQKVKQDWRLRNTKLLLKNYRAFVAHSEEVKSKLADIEAAEALDELYSEEFAVESIRKSKQRTLVMVRFMKRMLAEYRIMCESSGQPEDLRRFQVIQEMYITEQKLSAEEIAKMHKIETRTVYKDVNNACKTLSVLIFGVDGIRFE